MALSLDLNKAAGSLKLDLSKRGVDANGIQMEVCFDLDVSGSYRDEHSDGSTQRLIERLTPVSMVFDPDKQQDLFTFSNGEQHVHHVGMITLENLDGYVRKNVIDRVPGYGGGTTYSYVLERNLQHFGWLPSAQTPAAPKSRFGGLFGGSPKPAPQATATKRRSLVIFNTDGENDSRDKDRTIRVLSDSQNRKDEVYFLFVGYANGGADLSFLQQIADRFDNTGLIIIRDINRWCAKSDAEINAEILGDELITWLKR